jgi:PAS domain S-box-containing protein
MSFATASAVGTFLTPASDLAQSQWRHFVTTRIRDNPDKFRMAVEAAPSAMIMADERGTILLINSQAERLFGYTRAELIGQSLEILVPERFRGVHAAFRQGFAAQPLSRPMGAGRDLFGLRKDGMEVPIEIGLNPIQDAENNKLLVLSSIVDITERKKAEAEREQLLVREKVARSEAEAANRIKDQFLATISHELRTPLNAILGWSLMLEKLEPHEAAHALDSIKRNARSLATLVDDLLDVSRIIAGKMQVEMQPVELIPIIEAAMNAVNPMAEAKHIHLQTSLDYGTGAVLGDPNRLQQILWNLLSNAVKFTAAGGRVNVRLERIDAHVSIAVSDTGKGIDAEFLPYVFERFVQQDGSVTRKHGGLGLGLAIVRHLVEVHGGTVQAHSDGLDKGATFVVKIPVLTTRKRFEARRTVTTTMAPDALKGLRVMVVDDEQDSRELLSFVLEQAAAEVKVAASASEAMMEFHEFRPDIMISDIGMPVEDGYSLIRRIRANSAAQGGTIPAIALTAHARAEDRIKAIASGFHTHVPKPIEPDELISVICGLMGLSGTL